MAAVGEHAPQPLYGPEAIVMQPQAAAGYLHEEDGHRRQLCPYEAEAGAQAEANAVEEDDACERLPYVARQCHTARCCQPDEVTGLGAAQVEQAQAADVGQGQRGDTQRVEQRVHCKAPWMAVCGAPGKEARRG